MQVETFVNMLNVDFYMSSRPNFPSRLTTA